MYVYMAQRIQGILLSTGDSTPFYNHKVVVLGCIIASYTIKVSYSIPINIFFISNASSRLCLAISIFLPDTFDSHRLLSPTLVFWDCDWNRKYKIPFSVNIALVTTRNSVCWEIFRLSEHFSLHLNLSFYFTAGISHSTDARYICRLLRTYHIFYRLPCCIKTFVMRLRRKLWRKSQFRWLLREFLLGINFICHVASFPGQSY